LTALSRNIPNTNKREKDREKGYAAGKGCRLPAIKHVEVRPALFFHHHLAKHVAEPHLVPRQHRRQANVIVPKFLLTL
jgi:hypothetical protein